MAASNRQLEDTSIDVVSPDERGTFRVVLQSYALLVGGSLVVAMLVLPVSALVRAVLGVRLGAAVPGTSSMAASIAANNAREAAIPFLFACVRGRRQWIVPLGDAVVYGSLGVNVALGGLALGAYGPTLFHYLPQWPLEWGGLAVALTGWRRARRVRRDPCELFLLAVGAALLLCIAALVETYAVPQT